jgi:GxxExxY protein
MTDILYREESYYIVGACMRVHQKLGPGFLESVYSEALGIEFDNVGIPYEKEKKLPVFYEGKPLNKYFRADFVCYDSIIVELKASKFLVEADRLQTLNNVKATNSKLGLLINFGMKSLVYKRVVNFASSSR